jgi:hypothetical protein
MCHQALTLSAPRRASDAGIDVHRHHQNDSPVSSMLTGRQTV